MTVNTEKVEAAHTMLRELDLTPEEYGDLAGRLITESITAARSQVDLSKLQRGGALDEREWGLIEQTRLPNRLIIDETASQSVAYIRRAARNARRRLGSLDLIVVDYLQLMTPGDHRVPHHARGD